MEAWREGCTELKNETKQDESKNEVELIHPRRSFFLRLSIFNFMFDQYNAN